jgi:hypothetical protein
MTSTPPPAPQQGIDPAEALLVITGLEPFLRHSSRDLGSAIVRSESLPDTLETRIYRFLGTTTPDATPEPPPFDFDEAVAFLDNPPPQGAIGKTMLAFGSNHDLGLRVGTEVTKVMAYLRGQIPRRKRAGLTGEHDLPPARSEFFRFKRCWQLAIDPLSLFDDLQAFFVSRDQVTCWGTMFPTTAAELWPTIQRAMVRKRVQIDGWEPTRKQEIQLRVYAADAAAKMATDQQEAQRASSGPSQANEGLPTSQLDAGQG